MKTFDVPYEIGDLVTPAHGKPNSGVIIYRIKAIRKNGYVVQTDNDIKYGTTQFVGKHQVMPYQQ